MSLIYAQEHNGKRHLVRIECDQSGCTLSLKPNPEIAESGWRHYGTDHGPGTERFEWDYCPKHLPRT